MNPFEFIVAIVAITSGAGVLKAIINAIGGGGRRGAAPKQLESIDERLARIEQAVETMAVEIERISEGQRFTTKLLAERPERSVIGR
jgi:hypothetical protein